MSVPRMFKSLFLAGLLAIGPASIAAALQLDR